MTEMISSGGWCAPGYADIQITSEMITEWAQRNPAGGPCSTCDGAGDLVSRPLCSCSMCAADVETIECWHCDGTGVEPDHDLKPGPMGLLDAAVVDLPTFAVRRGGIRYPDHSSA